MATQKQGSGRGRSGWLRTLLLLALLLAALAWFFRAPITGYADLGTAHAARNVCACQFTAGQAEGVCESNYVLGMPPVMLSSDSANKSVTARVPLISAATATHREGYGCVLEPYGE